MRAVPIALALVLAALPSPSRAAARADRNVVLIIMDDTGTDLFGAYGEVKPDMEPPPEHFVTPNIQELADRGLRFENAWSEPLCSPTRATILTGQLPFRNGLGAIYDIAPPGPENPYVPLPQLLGTAPVRPVRSLIGKWHLSDFDEACTTKSTPLADFYDTAVEAGFTQFVGNPDSSKLPDAGQYDWCEVMDGTGPTEPCSGGDPGSPFCEHRQVYETTAEVDRAIAFLEQAPQEPWFLQLSLHSVHRPLEAPPPELRPLTPDPLPDDRTLQRAMLEAMDTELGRFLDHLEQYDCGADDCHLGRTTVILVGDNGTALGLTLPTAVNRGTKTTLYEGGINVPLIVTGDAVNPARRGTSTGALVHTVDLYPTIAGMTAHPLPEGAVIDGVSFFLHVADSNEPPPRSCVYADGRFNTTEPTTQGRWGQPRNQHDTTVRNATHKLIRYATIETGVWNFEFFGLDLTTGHLNEWNLLPVPADASDPNYASYQELRAQLKDSVPIPCQPAELPPCGLGPELVPALLALLALRRSATRQRT
jgi:arylsulfatase A-like enzyme